MAHSSPTVAVRKAAPKPKKPRPDFPLFPHATGRWAKKVRGKFVYFGKVADDPKGEAAVAIWLDQKEELLAGRTPRGKAEGLTVEDLCDHFLNAKRPLVESGELTQRMFDEYLATGKRIVESFGRARLVDDLQPEDLSKLRASASKKWGLHRVAGEVQRVRTIFKYGFDAGRLDGEVDLILLAGVKRHRNRSVPAGFAHVARSLALIAARRVVSRGCRFHSARLTCCGLGRLNIAATSSAVTAPVKTSIV